MAVLHVPNVDGVCEVVVYAIGRSIVVCITAKWPSHGAGKCVGVDAAMNFTDIFVFVDNTTGRVVFDIVEAVFLQGQSE